MGVDPKKCMFFMKMVINLTFYFLFKILEMFVF